MVASRVAVTLDSHLLAEVDVWVASGDFPNRSKAVEAALLHLREGRGKRKRLLEELAKLTRCEEQDLADEDLIAGAIAPMFKEGKSTAPTFS